MDLEDLDALLESRYENDLEQDILDFESGNEKLNETFGTMGLEETQVFSRPLPMAHNVSSQLPGMHPIQPQTFMSQRPLMQFPIVHPIHQSQLPPQQIMQSPLMPGMRPQPMGGMSPGMGQNMMTMEDVEKLLIMNVSQKAMTAEDVEYMLKRQVSGVAESSGLDMAVEVKEETKPQKQGPIDVLRDVQKGVSRQEQVQKEIFVKDLGSVENLKKVKETKNRVHLEKIHRPSQSERKKNKNLQNSFFNKEDTRGSIRKREIFITNWEKELIAKIQISQLVSDDPMKDDFYCQIYSNFKKKQVQPSKGKKKSVGVNKIQQQMTRLIEKRKSKQIKGPMSLEGALGKISVLSSRNPRQVLSLDLGISSQKEKSKVEFSLSPKSVLNSIERVYDNVLELDALKRREAQDESEEWKEKFDFQLKDLWENLALSRSMSYSLPHPFGFFLKFAKGIKIIPRVLKYLNSEQQFTLFSTLMCRLECVEIANLSVSSDKPEIDVFMSYVIPPFVDYVSDIGLDKVNSLMKTILERHNMVWVATSKIGLAFLTAFLSRAELLKQGNTQQGVEAPNENDLTLWTDIYNFLFSSIQGSFSSLFTGQSTEKTESLPGEIYIWQFLASLAVCATNVDQQTILVTEVRDNIISTAKKATDPKALANVDLFLTALGLGIDASQLASSV